MNTSGVVGVGLRQTPIPKITDSIDRVGSWRTQCHDIARTGRQGGCGTGRGSVIVPPVSARMIRAPRRKVI